MRKFYGLRLTCSLLLLAPGILAQNPSEVVILNDDGAWCWYQDERAIIHDGKLIFGSVAAGVEDRSRVGDIEVVTYEFETGKLSRTELHDRLWDRRPGYDDHNAPAFLVRTDGRILAVYSKHGPEPHFYYRITEVPGDSTLWQPVRRHVASPSTRLTYSNLHFLSWENGGRGRIFNFFRGLDNSYKPSYVMSDDEGETWTTGNVIIQVPTEERHRPYVKYAGDGQGTIHLVYTEGHPHAYDNSVYHIYYRQGNLHRSDGTVIRSLQEGLKRPEEGTRIFHGNGHRVAWTSDLHLDPEGRPYTAFSVAVEPRERPLGAGGLDHRYQYAKWTGSAWQQYEIAYGGSCLYWWEDHYTGNIALDPNDPNIVFIATDVDPDTGEPLRSRGDGGRHYEIYRGTTADAGESWKWWAVTSNSRVDNIRPVVPSWDKHHTALLWMRGTYSTYTNYDMEIVGMFFEMPDEIEE